MVKFTKININDIKPADYNPRIMKPSEQLKLKKNLETFGLVDPIIVDLTDNNTIIGGHQRLEVLKDINPDMDLKLLKLGDIGLVFWETDFKIKDKNDQKAMNLALNKITGEWDYPKLDDLLIELNDDNYLLELTGFDESDLIIDDNMFSSDLDILDDLEDNEENNNSTGNVQEEPSKEDVIPLKQVDVIIHEGDKYQLGNHVLLCADSSNMDNIKKLIDDVKVDLLLTDPPYGINIVNTSNKGERESM